MDRSPYFPGWIAISIFSVSSLMAHLATLTTTSSSSFLSSSFAQMYVLGAIGISTIVSLSIVIAHYFTPEIFFAHRHNLEGYFSIVLVVLWMSILVFVMRPDNNIATNEDGLITNSSLYVSSWAAWVFVVLLVTSLLGDDREYSTASQQIIPIETTHWLSWFLTSVILLLSAFNLDHIDKCLTSFTAESTFCRNVLFAVTFGLSGIIISTAFIALTMTRVLRYHPLREEWYKLSQTVQPYLTFHSWTTICIFSCANCMEYVLHKTIRSEKLNHVILATCISFFLSIMSIVAHFRSQETFVGQKLEYVVTLVILVSWAPSFFVVFQGTDNTIPMSAYAIVLSAVAILCILLCFQRPRVYQYLPTQNVSSKEFLVCSWKS
jgi:hypothetical protein